MEELVRKKRLLDETQVPHYEQQYDFTCGPASLMMIFKHFDKKFKFNTEIETDIWRESSLTPLPPTTRYGLAFSALKRGYKAEIVTNVKGIEFVSKTPTRLTGRGRAGLMQAFLGLMQAQFEERRKRAFELGLKERKVKAVGVASVIDAIERKGLSIMLTSARFFEDEDWAHWVVITGNDERNVYVNDPGSLANKGRRVFSLKDFARVNGYYGDQVLISIFR